MSVNSVLHPFTRTTYFRDILKKKKAKNSSLRFHFPAEQRTGGLGTTTWSFEYRCLSPVLILFCIIYKMPASKESEYKGDLLHLVGWMLESMNCLTNTNCNMTASKTTGLCDGNSLHLKVKKKNGIFVPAHAKKSCKRKWGIASRALNFGARTEVTNFTPLTLYSAEKKSVTHWTEGGLGSTAGLGVLKERRSPVLSRNRTRDRPVHSLAYRPCYPVHLLVHFLFITYTICSIGTEDHPASCKICTGSLSWGVKRLRRGVDHQPHQAPRLKKE